MDRYVTGAVIRKLRESKKMTQEELAERIHVSCCGITLPALEPETAGADHMIHVEIVEDEYYVTIDHPMNKDHFISFLAAVSDYRIQFVKLYPEGNAEARFKMDYVKYIYAYCNHHGLFKQKMK